MKHKLFTIILLSVCFLFQLAVPVIFIAEKEIILTRGTEYKFAVSYIFEEDDNELELSYPGEYIISDDIYYGYAEFYKESNGLCYIDKLAQKVTSESKYLRSASSIEYKLPISYYTLKNDNADELALKAQQMINSNRSFYTSVRVLNGKSVITGVFLDDGTPIENLI